MGSADAPEGRLRPVGRTPRLPGSVVARVSSTARGSCRARRAQKSPPTPPPKSPPPKPPPKSPPP
ncbi:hypothetical protein CWC38_11040 [Kocuria tytonicola]|nr:hypothetical protein CWC38_11040 [Kocuria tytonicola]